MSQKLLNRVFSAVATFSLLVNSLSAPLAVYAQEVTPEPTPIVEETPTPTPTEEPIITPEVTPTPPEEVTPTPIEEITPTPTIEETLTPTPEVQTDSQPSQDSQSSQTQEATGEPTPTPTPEVTVEETQEQGVVDAVILHDTSATSIDEFDFSYQSDGSATLTTDKADYSPTDTVLITGTGFIPNKSYSIEITSDTGNFKFSDRVSSDESGNLFYSYQLDGTMRPNYTVFIKNGEIIVASTTFTDPDNPATTIDQCQNGGVGDPLQPCSETAPDNADSGYGYEGNSSANFTNSHWNEGDFVPLRIVATNYSAGAGNIQFSIDVTKGSKHAYDYIGSFDATETTGASSATNANHNNPVTDIISGASATSPDSVGTVPAATLAGFPVACGSNTFVGSQVAGQVNAWGTSGPLTVTYVSQNVGSSDCTTTIQVAWGATQASFGGTIVVAYGAHIAKQTDWGNGNSAISINGSPYHTSLVRYTTGGETKGIGQQDAKLAASAVIVPGSINIIKNTVSGNGTFNYTATGSGLSNFGVTTSGNTGNHLFSSLIPGADGGTRTIIETVPAGWALTGLTCTSTLQNNQNAPLSTYSTDLAGGIVTVSNLAEGDTVTCTYTNTVQNGHIIVDKVTNPSGSNQSFNFDGSGGSYADFSLTDAAAPNNQELLPGNYSVSETVPTGWDLTNTTCVSSIQDTETAGSLELDSNETITCTFTNTQRGHIIIDKVTIPAGDPQSFSFDASGGSYGDFSLTDLGLPNDQELVPGSYGISETEPSGWDLTNTSCVSSLQDTETVASLDLDPGETITCTFTNTKLGEISGFKYQDLDGNTNTTEYLANPVQGLLVQLWQWITSAYQNTGQTDTTDSSGFYSFTGLLPGLYQVREVLSSLGASWTNLTSTSVDVNLAAGEIDGQNNFINTQYGSIVVIKQTDPDGDPQVFDFDLSYGDLDADLSDGQSDDSGDLLPGTYSVSENTPAGWDLTSATCDDGSDPSSIGLSSNETVMCTFTNQKDSGIVVIKQTDPDGSQQNFEFDSNYHNENFFLTDGFVDLSGDLLPGTYSVTELTTAGWDLTSATCDDGSDPSSIGLSAGETVTCTFTNTELGNVTVVKYNDHNGNGVKDDGDEVLGDTGDGEEIEATRWEIHLVGTNVNSYQWTGAQIAGQVTFSDLLPNSFTLSEQIKPGWVQTNIACGDEVGIDNDNSHSVVLEAGEDLTCYIGNQGQGTIVVEKNVEPDSDATFDFTIKGSLIETIGFVLGDGDSTDPDYSGLPAGTYAVSEEANELYTTSVDCVSSLEDEETADSVELDPGEVITCTFTNTRDAGTITIDKVTNPSESPEQFTINLMQGETVQTSDLVHGSVLADQDTPDTYIVPTGTYWLTELEKTGWDLTGATCTDGEVSFNALADQFEVVKGVHLTCTFNNTQVLPSINISKSNDKSGGASAGDTVTYTLIITNTGNVAIGSVIVTDSLPGGFTYEGGSTSIDGAPDVEPTVSGSTLEWSIGSVFPGEPVTITYQAKIASDMSAGTYKNYATCEGQVGGLLDLISEFIDGDGQFEPEPISCNTDDSDVPIGQTFSYGGQLTPQVLGAATELPATGSSTSLLLFALVVGGFGIFTKIRAYKMGRRKYAKN